MLCYLALNFIFLYVAPVDALKGQLEVGYVAAQFVFGDIGSAIMGVSLALLLVSTVSAMTIAGPRVLQVIGQDFSAFRALSKTNKNNVPYVAIITQSSLCLLFILTGTFESILIFAGFTLGVNTFLAVLGVFIERIRKPDLPRPYKTWGYPLTPLIYLAVTAWTLIYICIDKPKEAFLSLLLIFGGIVFYLISQQFQKIPSYHD